MKKTKQLSKEVENLKTLMNAKAIIADEMKTYMIQGEANAVTEAAHENEPRLAVPSCYGRRIS